MDAKYVLRIELAKDARLPWFWKIIFVNRPVRKDISFQVQNVYHVRKIVKHALLAINVSIVKIKHICMEESVMIVVQLVLLPIKTNLSAFLVTVLAKHV
jgi:hypothetical protein